MFVSTVQRLVLLKNAQNVLKVPVVAVLHIATTVIVVLSFVKHALQKKQNVIQKIVKLLYVVKNLRVPILQINL